MANVRTLRRRIRSVQNTAKITKAMQMIAASKMRRAQQATLSGRPYEEKLRGVLADLAAQPMDMEEVHPLLQHRDVRNIQLIHITPDRGLCGGLNGNLNRASGKFILDQSATVSVIAIGRKGRDFMTRSGRDVQAVFSDMGDRPNITDITPVSHLAIEGYVTGKIDQVLVTYSEFVSTAVQRPVIRQLLPVEPAPLGAGQSVGYIFEPSGVAVLDTLLPRFVEMELYHAVLESIASEHSARMVAMRNATDNANEMLDNLTITLNKVRQESITKDLLDIVGGVAALE